MAKFGFLFIGSGSEGAEAPTVWDKARRTIGRIQVMRTVEHYAYILPVGCNPSVRVYSNKAIKVIRISPRFISQFVPWFGLLFIALTRQKKGRTSSSFFGSGRRIRTSTYRVRVRQCFIQNAHFKHISGLSYLSNVSVDFLRFFTRNYSNIFCFVVEQ